MAVEPTLPALARAVAEWFPELGGRAMAVSEAEVTKENVPTMPLALVALARETAKHKAASSRPPEISENILLQFWFKPDVYRRQDGSESPFWAYYDFEALRDRLLSQLSNWLTPRGFKLSYEGLDIEADHFAVIVTFKLCHDFNWCDEAAADGVQFEPACNAGAIAFNLLPKKLPA